MDVVYILRPWYDNCMELRYSIRSLQNIKHGNIYIIWYKPIWAKNIIHIPANDPFTVKALNALHKIKIACNDERISDDFILMNDDFYITKPTEVKYYHQGTIKEHLNRRVARVWTNNYIEWIRKTLKLFPEWLDYSIHYPIIYNKEKFLNLFEEYNMDQWLLLRNLYCNHYWVQWEQAKDYKIRNLGELPKGKIPTFISNDDWLIVNEVFRGFLNKLFPKPSKYEIQEEVNIKVTNLYNKIEPMLLKWKPNYTINRFWNKYISNNEWILEANTEEERVVFNAYGFRGEKKIDIYEEYIQKFWKKVPNNKKNDQEWIKNKLNSK